MKLLLFLLSFSIASNPGILMIDTALKNGVETTNDFTVEEFFKRRFPIYADDKKTVSEGIIKIAKLINQNQVLSDTVDANHTKIYLHINPERVNTISVRLMTKIQGKDMFFDFSIVQNETDRRAAQRRLMDLSTYLEQ